MENLNIPLTEKTLRIDFNAESGVLEMEGLSYSEKNWQFFQRLNKWIEQYISEGANNITLNLKIRYLDSTSTRYLIDFISILETYHENGGKVKVRWYYEDGDDIEEMGVELAEDLKLPIELVVY